MPPRPRSMMILPALLGMTVFGVLFYCDRLLRFFQGDSISYLSTGMNGWIPPDRSWAYGFASRWIVELTRRPAGLVAVQDAMLLGAILLLAAVFAGGRRQAAAALAFVGIASLDPLSQTYARFWLSDTAAAAAFLVFVALVAAGLFDARRRLLLLPVLVASVLVSVFVRVAYAPIEIAMLLILFAATFLPGFGRVPGLRRQLLGLALIPVLATGSLALANSRVSIASLHGQIFINRVSCLFNMGVSLPGLRYADFQRAGVPMTQAEFDGFHLDRYDNRALQMWGAEPYRLLPFLKARLNTPDTNDARLQQSCSAVMRSALTHHPQTLALTYLHGLALYLDSGVWERALRLEMGFDRKLPGWVAVYLTNVSGIPVAPDITARQSLLPNMLAQIIGFYPFLLIAGVANALFVLLSGRSFGRGHVLAAAFLSTLCTAPLYSQAIDARYVLAAVLLGELQLAILCTDTMQTIFVRRRTAAIV